VSVPKKKPESYSEISHLGLPYPAGRWSSSHCLAKRRALFYVRLLRGYIGLEGARIMLAHLYRDSIFEWRSRATKSAKPIKQQPTQKRKPKR
jgi:hypothetical protein